LRELYPGAYITWVVDDRCAEILEGNTAINQLLIFPRFALIQAVRAGKYGLAAELLSDFTKILRSRKYDLSLDLHGLFKSAVIALIAGAKLKVGSSSTNGMREGSWIVSKQVKRADNAGHCIVRHLEAIKYLGGDITKKVFEINISENERVFIDNLLKKNGVNTAGKVVVFHVGGGWASRRWLPEKFAELADKLVEQYKIIPVFVGGEVGGKAEVGLVESVIALMKTKALDFANMLTLKQYSALLKRSVMFIGNEAGPMHIAGALGVPVVAIIGPTDPGRTGPYGDKNIVVRKKVNCAPCRKRDCQLRICIDKISVEEVFNAAGKWMIDG